MNDIVFYILAAVTIGSAMAVVTMRNIVHSAFYLVLMFAGVAGIYVLLNASFVAAVQILVYAGAVAILIAFGVMLTRKGNIQESNLFNKHAGPALVVVLAVGAVIVMLVTNTNWAISSAQPVADSVGSLATMMLNDYVVPFEAASVLLLAAMLGAIVIAKEVKNSK